MRDAISRERVFRNAARYLGYRGHTLPEGAEALLEDAYADLLRVAEPKLRLVRCAASISGGALTLGDMPPVDSADLCRLFAGATEGYALLSTLGAGVDFRVQRLMLTSPALGAAVGACASAYIDEFLDAELEKERATLLLEGLTLSPRFSPGYGDAPLAMQRPLLNLLQAWRLGVSLTTGMLMLPEKSVSAVIALRRAGEASGVDKPRDALESAQNPASRCSACGMKECAYRER